MFKQMHGVATASHMALHAHVGNGPEYHLRATVHPQFNSGGFSHHHVRSLGMDNSNDIQNGRTRYSMHSDNMAPMSFSPSLYPSSSNRSDMSSSTSTTGPSPHGDRRPTPILPPFQTSHTKISQPQLPSFDNTIPNDPMSDQQWRTGGRPTNTPESNSNANPIYDMNPYMTAGHESRPLDELDMVPPNSRINSTGVRSPNRSDATMLNSDIAMDSPSNQTALSFYSNRPVAGFEPGGSSTYANGFPSIPTSQQHSLEYQSSMTMAESNSIPTTVSVMNGHQQEAMANGGPAHSQTITAPVTPPSQSVPRRPSIPAPHMMSTFSAKVVTSTPKRYKCTVCSKRFTRPSSLTTHTYSHTGEKPYTCGVEGCGRNFSVVSNLRRHTKIHNASTP
ncbi:hypothetical protein BC937DRAFT_86995 [Endogone sp. FLAS-F59071]|nr:hypothetical protein BC937DRAFT_86995 [Endogone sp. FLAS-F59071]|eukprot:RUS12799.1 hypothetical protein BC937DRAFT_86995 [Endogone sp. FLAS-F59071]